jgi:hypothetical protein
LVVVVVVVAMVVVGVMDLVVIIPTLAHRKVGEVVVVVGWGVDLMVHAQP